MATKKTRTTIDQYKDRMTSPFGVVLTDPKTRKPKKSVKTDTKKKGK